MDKCPIPVFSSILFHHSIAHFWSGHRRELYFCCTFLFVVAGKAQPEENVQNGQVSDLNIFRDFAETGNPRNIARVGGRMFKELLTDVEARRR
jgi:hypothetical protein